MIDKEFIAHLSSTQTDVRILNAKVVDAKQIKLKDKNILDYIKESEFNSYDTRDPQLKNDELDIWNTEISLSEEGHIEVKPFEHTFDGMTDEQKELLSNSASKIIGNEVFDTNNNHLMYWQTDGLTNGSGMFYNCYELTSFDSDLSSLTDGEGLFYGCSNLTSFSSDLSSFTNCDYMFSYCTNLTTFDSDLSSLKEAQSMFKNCSSLTSFDSDLSSLTYGYEMFTECSSLTSFNGDLSSLTNGEYMFFLCNNLTTFTSDLSSLYTGVDMFSYCSLDAPSVANIVHTLLSDESDKEINIGIGCDNTAEDQLLFAQECDCETWQELLDEFDAKNWIVYFGCNGRPTTTYNMRRGETLPIYAKLEEVIMHTDEKKHKPHYAYTSADGSKFYNIKYFHSTNGSTEGYDVFSSLEEAISTYNVTPKN